MTSQGSRPTTEGWRARLRAWAPAARDRRRSGRNRSRGAAELSVLAVTGSLVAGVFFGQGISDTAVDVVDGLTWLSDDEQGQVIQVNPATGALEVKQVVGNPGDDIEVSGEHDGQLYVTDHTTGRLVAFDLSSILVSGQRRVSAGGVVDTLTNDDGVFLVDREQSTIAAMDPQSTQAVGTIWVAPSGLADAAVDGDGVIWAVEDDGTLHRLDWSTDELAFDDEEDAVEGSADGSVLVAHDRGVTVFGPDLGMVAQVGTGDDRTSDAPKVSGDLLAPERSPYDLVPVAADNGYVVLLTPGGVREVDMGAVGCDEPGTPEVFRGEVFVPCRGEGRVVRLDGDGRRAGRDLETPGSDDPELVLDDDNLVVNAPGAPRGLVVHGDGSTTTIVREDAEVPANGLTDAGTPPPNPVEQLLDDVLDLDGDDEQDDRPTPTPPSSPGSTPPGPQGLVGGGGDRCDDPGTSSSAGPGAQGTQGGKGAKGAKGVDKGAKGTGGSGTTSCTPGSGGSGSGGSGSGGSGSGGTGSAGEPVTAPTDVVATPMAEGQVQLTWRHSALPPADAFVVRASTGRTYPAFKGWVRQGFVEVTPGEATSFTVTAVLGDRQAVSASTAPVTSTARPGAPQVTSRAGYVERGNEVVFVVEVAWSGAAANGQAITNYDVSVTTPDGPRAAQVAGTQSSLQLSWSCDVVVDPACTVGGDWTATVTPRSSLGAGAAGVTKGKAPAQPPARLPAAGKAVVDRSAPRTDQAGDDGAGSIDLRLRPPADWARFPGTCHYVLDGGSPTPVACNAAAVSIAYANQVIYTPDDGTRDHAVVFTAENARGKVTSATFTFQTQQTPQAPPVEPDPQPDPQPDPGPQQPPCYPTDGVCPDIP
ncbi:hypothetical protein [Nocardioides litoris]|uniref:hypothetical protein n=1 Tax=Nocardioides litoris TaxID=1926648 RepID=UPI00111DE0B2|nr:hypothetical protein [Nocardioides litoris]